MGKVAIIGAGRVGSITAYTIAQRGIAKEIVLVDINEALVGGQAEDIAQSLALHNGAVVRHGGYEDISGSKVIVITCGAPRGPGTSDRMLLLEKNKGIMVPVAEKIRQYAKGAVIITVTNPVDVMNYLIRKATGFSQERVLGFGSLLDSARFRRIISQKLGCKIGDVKNAFVIGEHGEGMVPLFSKVKIRGQAHAFSDDEKREISGAVRRASAGIIQKKGGTEFGPAAYVADIAEAILKGRKEIMPVSIVRGECSLGVLAKIGKGGAKPVEMNLDESEKKAFFDAKEKISLAIRQPIGN